ncbi:hypothetical protein FHR25_000816 [Yokenella regensburgei]|nr:hypothetical protein FHR25_000816 [Yokenella regensburgei]
MTAGYYEFRSMFLVREMTRAKIFYLAQELSVLRIYLNLKPKYYFPIPVQNIYFNQRT